MKTYGKPCEECHSRKCECLPWVTFTKRTDDPKLSHLESLLDKAGIRHRRHGESWHAPILQVRENNLEKADAILASDVFGDGTVYDDIPDDDPVFAEDPESTKEYFDRYIAGDR